MSYGIMAYPADLRVLRKWVGSGDVRLADGLANYFTASLTYLDSEFEDDEPSLSARDAFRQLIIETELDQRQGSLYAYCFKLLCQYSTDYEMLSNRHWSGMRFGWFETVAAELKAQGVDFDPTDLVFSGPPVPLPHPSGFPNVGHVANAEMPALLEKLDRFDGAKADPSVADAVEEMRSWLRDCREYELDLVCFYH
ncbi:DUF7691 family protein [Actinomadura kijaniata]|uniref:DUF7691 family protein n=1 Tax=Actinomadura kijaniata TaxID=46161 RepID=UPI000AD237A1|nr:hypothetical protein [Actinomadura kijaniata]